MSLIGSTSKIQRRRQFDGRREVAKATSKWLRAKKFKPGTAARANPRAAKAEDIPPCHRGSEPSFDNTLGFINGVQHQPFDFRMYLSFLHCAFMETL